jgi:hypothetical protein
MTTSTKYFLRLATLVLVGLAFLVPALLESQRRSGGGGGGGRGGGGHVSSGSSVRQSRTASKPTPQRSSASRPTPQRSTASSRPSAPANRPSPSTRQATPSNRSTTGNQANRTNLNERNRTTNRDASRDGNRTNISGNDVRKRDVNINGDVNIDRDRDFDNVDFDNVENVHISGGEHNVWVNEGEIHVYEDYEGWKVFAGATAAIAVGTMLTRPPVGYTTVYVGPTPYYYYDNAYYTQVYSGGDVAYQVVAPPAGAIITTLPSGCAQSGPYWTCGNVYYQRSGSGYAVITNPF